MKRLKAFKFDLGWHFFRGEHKILIVVAENMAQANEIFYSYYPKAAPEKTEEIGRVVNHKDTMYGEPTDYIYGIEALRDIYKTNTRIQEKMCTAILEILNAKDN